MITRVVNTLESCLFGAMSHLGQRVLDRVLVNAERIPDARFLGFTLVIPFLALVAIPVLISDSVVLNAWMFDYAIPLDTSLRWLNGHVPHLDYQTPIGVAYWLFQGLATDFLGGLDARTPVVANFLAVLPIVICAAVLLRPRLSGGLFGLAILAIVLLVISPRSPGDVPGQLSFLAAYNKVGLAILSIMLISTFVEPRRARSTSALSVEAMILGLLLLWLVYLKVTFAIVAVVGCLVALHYAPKNRLMAVTGVLLAGLGVAAIGWISGINAAYFDDLSVAAASGSPLRFGKMVVDLDESRLTLIACLISLVFYWHVSPAERSVRRSNLIVGLGLFAAGVVAMNQVHDNSLALSFVALLVLAQRAIAEAAGYGGIGRWRSYMPPLIGAIALIITAMLADAISSGYYYSTGRDYDVADHPNSICENPDVPACRIIYPVFDTSVSDLVSPLPSPAFATTDETVGEIPLTVSEILEICDARETCLFWKIQEQLYQLLNRYIEPHDRPLFLGFSNILPYYYQTRPPKHVPAWLDVGRNISQESHPDPEVLFGDVTLLVVPKVYFKVGRIAGLNEIYQDDIPDYFDLVAETDSWEIWRKR